MKKALLLLLALFVIVGCNKKEDEKKGPTSNVDIYEIIDKEFKNNDITFIRESELNYDNYYALSGWQYAIDNATCIVDVYYFGEDSSVYKDALDKQAIRAKDYDNQYLTAIVNNGMAAIVWDGCQKEALIKNILINL